MRERKREEEGKKSETTGRGKEMRNKMNKLLEPVNIDDDDVVRMFNRN